MSVPRRQRRRRGGQLGVAIVEFAFAGSMFFVILLAIVDGAWYVSAANAAANSAREGARYGMAYGNTCQTSLVTPAAKAVAGPFQAMTVTAVSGTDSYGQYCDVTTSVTFRPFGFAFPFVSQVITSRSHEYDN